MSEKEKHSGMTVEMDTGGGTVKQKAKMQTMQLQDGGFFGGKATTFQFWKWVVFLVIVGSTLPVAMWGFLGDFTDFIRIRQQSSSSFTRGPAGVVDYMKEDHVQSCMGRRVYIYELPSQFNVDLLDLFCLEKYEQHHMCESYINGGFGAKMEHVMDPVEVAWYRTEQFSLEPIIHERFKHYRCLTDNPELADLFYLPYYVGLDLTTNLYSKMQLRDVLANRFVGWLLGQPTWARTQGNNHFMVLGRMVWDFGREVEMDGWGNSILTATHELQNVTKAFLERNPWDGERNRQIAIPYPTSFHPESGMELDLWQKKVAESKRDVLVSFAGAPRNVIERPKMAIRDILFEQCTNSERCSTLLCSQMDCPRNPHFITNLFLSSNFCFQPPGDSATRKAVFDCLAAGTIPVFFNPDSAYNQYKWHLPADGSSYSVFIDEEDLLVTRRNVIDILAEIPQSRIEQMQLLIREEIIPRIVYDMPGGAGRDPKRKVKDAFDIVLEHLFDPGFRTYPSSQEEGFNQAPKKSPQSV